jgi:hypothetical protein
MAFYHNAFTAKWAADYTPIPILYKTLFQLASGSKDFALEEMRSVFDEHHRMHILVAKKLVPNDKSLLQNHKHKIQATRCSRDKQFLYDSFFHVMRSNSNTVGLTSSLNRRVRAILYDLSIAPAIQEGTASYQEMPSEMHALEMVKYREEIPDLLQRVISSSQRLLSERQSVCNPTFAA